MKYTFPVLQMLSFLVTVLFLCSCEYYRPYGNKGVLPAEETSGYPPREEQHTHSSDEDHHTDHNVHNYHYQEKSIHDSSAIKNDTINLSKFAEQDSLQHTDPEVSKESHAKHEGH